MVFAYAYQLLLGQWLYKLYRSGPMWTPWGFWAGLADADVCARLAGSVSQASDWLTSNNVPTRACVAMIQRAYNSFAVTIHTGLYIVLVVYCLRCLVGLAVTRAQTRALATAFAREFARLQGAAVPLASRVSRRSLPATARASGPCLRAAVATAVHLQASPN